MSMFYVCELAEIHRQHSVQDLTKQLKRLEEDKDAEEKAAKWEAKDLKDQLEDLKAHHSMATDLFVSSSS